LRIAPAREAAKVVRPVGRSTLTASRAGAISTAGGGPEKGVKLWSYDRGRTADVSTVEALPASARSYKAANRGASGKVRWIAQTAVQ